MAVHCCGLAIVQENPHTRMYRFKRDLNGWVNVWTDGACLNNGRNNPSAGIGVYFDDGHPANVSRPVPNGYRQTNNVAEILAAKDAAINALKGGVRKLRIHTDSHFMIDCVVEYMQIWKNNGWHKTNGQPVVNRRELIELDRALGKLAVVQWVHIQSHSGNYRNEMADRLAKAGASQSYY